MTQRELQTIITAYDEGSFLAAAKKLYVSQSALSQSIRKLEQKLGAALFVTSGNHVRPTRLCNTIVTQGRPLLREWYSFEAGIDASIRQSTSEINILSIANLITSFLIPAVKRFEATHPDIVVNITEVLQSSIYDQVRDNPKNLGILVEDTLPVSVEMIPLLKTRYLLAVPASHPFAIKHPFNGFDRIETVDLNEFRNEPFALPARNSQHNPYLLKIFESAGFEPNIRFELRNVGYLRDYVSTGAALSLISSHNAKTHPEDKSVAYYRLDLPLTERTIYACRSLDAQPTPEITDLLKEISASQPDIL